MTALSATSYNGCSYAAATQIAKTSAQTVTGNESSEKNNSAPDVLTISAEGLDALSKIENAKIYEPKQYLDLSTFKKHEIISITEGYEKNSKHFSPIAWALGIDVEAKTLKNSIDFLWSEEGVLTMRAQLQQRREGIDNKISDLLQSNNITLGDKETLNITVNHLGKIAVGDGLSSDKKTQIEKLLNEDGTLAQDLLLTHAERHYAVMGDYDPYDSRQSAENRYIVTDTILRREYGVSLDDFRKSEKSEYGVDENGQIRLDEYGKPHSNIVAKDGNNEVLNKIRSEESVLYSDIAIVLNSAEEYGGEFEVSYAYKNGVTIEKGVTDETSLSKVASTFTPYEFTHFDVQTLVTIDPSGAVVDSAVTDFGSSESSAVIQKLQSFYGFAAKTGERTGLYNNTNILPTQSRLQQFAFDAQRLFQFNTGLNEEAIKAMNVTFATNSK